MSDEEFKDSITVDEKLTVDENITVDEIINEVYTVDYLSPYFLYAGNDDKCTIYDTKSHSISTVIEGFTDSVIFCKFLSQDRILTCTLDGHILITSICGKHTCETQVNDEISVVRLYDDNLFVGTNCGTLYMIKIDTDLNDQRVYMGHSSAILDILYYNNTVYSLSENTLLSHRQDLKRNVVEKDIRLKLVEGIAFSMIPNTEIFCVCTASAILIYKGLSLINKFKIDGQAETVN